MSETRTLGWRGKALLALLSPIVVFALLEIGLRIGGYRYAPWEERLKGLTYEELTQRRVYDPDPVLIWTLRPSTVLDVDYMGFKGIPTNSDGLRGRELPGPKGPDELRVLCLGDSVTFCLGLAEGETWPDRMEQALQATPSLAGRRVRVVNGAVPGYSSVQGRRVFERLRHLDFDVVVFWYGLPDANPMRDLPDSMQTLPVEGVPRLLSLAWRLRAFQLVQQVVTAARRVSAEGTRVSRAEFRANVEYFLELEREGGPKALFVHEPERCAVTITQLERIVARGEEQNVELLIAPRRLLTWIVPAPEGVDLRGKLVTWCDRTALRFEPDARLPGYAKSDTAMEVGRVREDLERLRTLKASLDAILAQLPEDALGYEDLFGDSLPDYVFADNCHLSPLGARLAGEALARAALEALGRER